MLEVGSLSFTRALDAVVRWQVTLAVLATSITRLARCIAQYLRDAMSVLPNTEEGIEGGTPK